MRLWTDSNLAFLKHVIDGLFYFINYHFNWKFTPPPNNLKYQIFSIKIQEVEKKNSYGAILTICRNLKWNLLFLKLSFDNIIGA